jgi:hypothetical protein
VQDSCDIQADLLTGADVIVYLYRPALYWRMALAVVLGGCLLSSPTSLEAKRRIGPIHPPELRILNVAISPGQFVAGSGSLELTIDLELPADLSPNMILEVSSLISSPSKRSLRFLANRQALDPVALTKAIDATGSDGAKPRLAVTLVWDGTDQTRQPVSAGRYAYEVRAKLLSAGESGPPRTQMVSWPRRGMVMVGSGEAPP